MMIEMSVMTVIIESMMNCKTIRIVKFSAVHSFDLESLRTTFCKFSLFILSDLKISHRNKHV